MERKGLPIVAMAHALAMGISMDSLVDSIMPAGPYKPEHFYDEEDYESVQTKVHAAETKRARKNAKRLRDHT